MKLPVGATSFDAVAAVDVGDSEPSGDMTELEPDAGAVADEVVGEPVSTLIVLVDELLVVDPLEHAVSANKELPATTNASRKRETRVLITTAS